MMALNTQMNFEAGDLFYAQLADWADRQKPDEALSAAYRLILLLANQIGNQTLLSDALERVPPQEGPDCR